MSDLSERRMAGAGQKLDVDGVVQFGAFDEPCRSVLLSVDGHPARVRFDGTAPDATTGVCLPVGYVALWSRELASAAKFIKTAAGASVVFGSPMS